MKKFFFIAIFALASTFGFASNTVHPAKFKNTQPTQQIDKKTLDEKAQITEMGMGEFKYAPQDKVTNPALDDTFQYIDMCGQVWNMYTWGFITREEALAILALIDPLLCVLDFFFIVFF